MSYDDGGQYKLDDVVMAFFNELRRAEQIHPNWPEDRVYQSIILTEEVLELVQAAQEYETERITNGNFSQIEDELLEQMATEAIQVGAMAMRFLLNHHKVKK